MGAEGSHHPKALASPGREYPRRQQSSREFVPVIDNPEKLRRLGGFVSRVLSRDPKSLSERTGLAERTTRDWHKQQHVPDVWHKTLAAVLFGELDAIDKAFRGWRIEDGKLHAPENGEYIFAPKDLMWIPHARRIIANLERQIRSLRVQAERALEDQQREHDARLAELAVPFQRDWVAGEFRPATPVVVDEPHQHGLALFTRGAVDYRVRSAHRDGKS